MTTIPFLTFVVYQLAGLFLLGCLVTVVHKILTRIARRFPSIRQYL